MKEELKNINFVEHIQKLMVEKGLTVMEAVVHTHEFYDIEVEKLASLVKSSSKIKALLLEEAKRLNMMKKASLL